MAFLNSPFIHGSGFRLRYRDFNGACLFNTDNKIINNSNEVSNLFDNLFATVAEKIGENVVYDPSNHPSITAIHENNSIEWNEKFWFQKVQQ
jgi:hypothetical protein